MDTLRYPIGQFPAVQGPTGEQRKQFIESIAEMPEKLRQAVEGLGLEQLNTPYRPGGWTLKQVVHHLADAEMNAYIRFKRGLLHSNLGGRALDRHRSVPERQSRCQSESRGHSSSIHLAYTRTHGSHR